MKCPESRPEQARRTTSALPDELTIRVEPKAERPYREAPYQERRKLAHLLCLRLQDLANPQTTLTDIMKSLSAQAKANGLTPEMLESILNEG